MGTDVVESGYGLIWDTIAISAWMDRIKFPKPSLVTDCFWPEISNRVPPNTKL